MKTSISVLVLEVEFKLSSAYKTRLQYNDSTSIVMFCLQNTDLQFYLLPNDMQNYILLLRIDVVFCTRKAVL